jgi:hypothetical protein
MIQNQLVSYYPTTKFWHAPNFVTDIINDNERKDIILKEHVRAHRGIDNLIESILRDYYFPKMRRLATEIVANCKTCQEAKDNQLIKTHE